MTVPAVSVRDLRVELLATGADVIDEVDFDIAPGEVLGLVGESASGKTTAAQALLGFARRGARIANGAIEIGEIELRSCSPDRLREVRGGIVAYIPQDPGAALSPALRVGSQLDDALRVHMPRAEATERRERILQTLREVSLPAEESFLRRYPHQLSGGQLQRVAIAMAFALRPRVIVADEPTTGLDVTTQARVLETIKQLGSAHGSALLYVSHDLAVVSELADRVAVMYAGRIVEIGSRDEIFGAPRHPYTRGLLDAAPKLEADGPPAGIPGWAPAPGSRPHGCSFAPRCPLAEERCTTVAPAAQEVSDGHLVRCLLAAEMPARTAERRPRPLPVATHDANPTLLASGILAAHNQHEVVHGVDLAIAGAECVALVGESGSGKTTLARCLVGLHREFKGSVSLDGVAVARSARQRTGEQRQRLQYIFQNPYASLNPRRSVGLTLARQVRLYFPVSRREAEDRALELLERVALPRQAAARRPDELSGGERQRVAIARALAAQPNVLVCDEITSSLDVSVQASIVDLLQELRLRSNLALLFVTHNLALVGTIADRVEVLRDGRIVERGDPSRVFAQPQHAYTQALIANTPTIEEGARRALRAPG